MTNFRINSPSPRIVLKDVKGEVYDLQEEARENSFAVLAFFKSSCPVCQYTFPFLNRIKMANPTLSIYGISQDKLDETEQFIKEYNLCFPVLIDEDLKKTRALSLIIVPTIFVLDTESIVNKISIGFVKEDLEYINLLTGPRPRLFKTSEDIPEYKPG